MRRQAVLVAIIGVVVVGAAVPATAAPVTHGSVSGNGSAWAAPAIAQWATTQSRAGLRVDYAATGSSRGRTDFADGATDFAVTDLTAAQAGDPVPSRPFRYLPLTGGAVAFPYQVQVDGVWKRDVRLSGPTIADIFRGRVTNWNDPAVTADNNGHQVAPDLPIIPVVRADASATTYRLTDWLSTSFPRRWSPFSDAGATAVFPAPAGNTVAVNGSAGVTNRVTQSYGNGAIGYVETSYAASAHLPVAAVQNASQHFLLPTAATVSFSLLRARFGADGVTDLHPLFVSRDPRSYPLAYFGYGMIPTAPSDPRMSTATRQTEVDFFGYAVCGGQASIQSLGYAALPLNLTRAGLTALAQLRRTDPAVDGGATRLTQCDNPTLTHHPDGSVTDNLAATVPPPADCTRRAAGPCAA